jgi:hypothetical protein
LVYFVAMRAETEQALAAFARHQYGIVTRRQLLDCDVARHQIAYLLKIGRLERLFESVYRVAGVPASWRQMLFAATSAGGERGGVASHRAALMLWGLPGGAELLEVTWPRWKRSQYDNVVTHESRRYDTIDVTVVEGVIPVTRPARTFLDVCALVERGVVDESVAEAAFEEAIRRDSVDIELVGTRYEALGGDFRLGGIVAMRIMKRWLPSAKHTDSRPETELLRLLHDHGLPDPMPQYRVWTGSGEFFDLDFAWPAQRVGLEFDSYRWHGGRIKHNKDARRTLRLTAREWQLVPVTDDELDAGCPNAVPALAALLKQK